MCPRRTPIEISRRSTLVSAVMNMKAGTRFTYHSLIKDAGLEYTANVRRSMGEVMLVLRRDGYVKASMDDKNHRQMIPVRADSGRLGWRPVFIRTNKTLRDVIAAEEDEETILARMNENVR